MASHSDADRLARMRANRSTPLIEACIGGDLDAVESLLSGRARPNSGDVRVSAACRLACSSGLWPQDNGVTPLLHACRRGHLDIVLALLKRGASGWIADVRYALALEHMETVLIGMSFPRALASRH